MPEAESDGGVRIRPAGPADVGTVAPLFDGYRQFYHLPPDLALCRRYLLDRLTRGEATIFLAEDVATGVALGFTQLYPTFSSLLAAPIFVLYDLYVAEAARGRGAGRLLMQRARAHALETGAKMITLSTAHTNTKAQALYESLGYRLDSAYRVYELML